MHMTRNATERDSHVDGRLVDGAHDGALRVDLRGRAGSVSADTLVLSWRTKHRGGTHDVAHGPHDDGGSTSVQAYTHKDI